MKRMAVLSVIISVVAGLFIYSGVEKALGGLLAISWVALVGIGLLIAAIGVAMTTRIGGLPIKVVIILALVLIILGLAGVGAASDTNTTDGLVDFTVTDTNWGLKFVPTYPNDAIIEEIEWNFGDGTTSSRISPTHWYADPGLYTVRVDIIFKDRAEAYHKSRVVEVGDRSQTELLLHTLEKDDDRVYIHLGEQDVVFTEMSLFISGFFCLAAGLYSSAEQKRYRRRGVRESEFGYGLRMLSLAWGVIAIALLLWLKAGGY